MNSPIFKLADVSNLSSSFSSFSDIDWAKCFICQNETGEKLVDPEKCTREGNAYSALAGNIVQFHNLGGLDCIDMKALLATHDSVEESLKCNKARYHKKCSLQFNNTKLERIRKRVCGQENIPPSPKKTRTSLNLSYRDDVCFFCEESETRSHPLCTLTSSDGVVECAKQLRDSKVLTMAAGTKGLKGFKYHKKCYSRYLNKVRPKAESDTKSQAHCIALAGLINYLHEVRADSVQPPAFKMADLARLYKEEMAALGEPCDVHTTRLRERLLEECGDLEATGRPGQDFLIAFKRDIDWSVREDCKRDFDQEARCLAKAAQIVRKDLFELKGSPESTRVVPVSLKSLVQMILHGTGLRSQDENSEEYDQVITSLSEILSFHVTKRTKGKNHRHNREQETPTPVYVATKMYGEFRSKELIDITYQLGLSISYSRLQTMLTEEADKLSKFYLRENVVCPPALRRKVFTTCAADNIDHKTSSTSASSEFHGTAISIMQHPTRSAPGEERTFQEEISTTKKGTRRSAKFELPADYSTVKLCFIDPKRGRCPTSQNCSLSEEDLSPRPFDEESEWLNSCLVPETCTTWSDFHSESDTKYPESDDFKTAVCVLPVFHEDAATVGMMRHCMGVVATCTEHLNPGQIPVIVVDQPLFALCKSIQWQDELFSENRFFVMFGGMHIELTALRIAGQWLNGSGWNKAMVEAGLSTVGSAEGLTKVNHLLRSRRAHQVTAAALFRLQKRAFLESCGATDDPQTFEEWRQERRDSSMQFRFWDIALEIELCVLQLVRALRTANFKLLLVALSNIAPWCFSLDHTHYARWLPVHIRDLLHVEYQHPELYEEFKRGGFVAHLSGRKFSAVALDQAHEQQNARLKGDGGMVGLTEDVYALRKWMLVTPQLALMNAMFEERLETKETSNLHHLSTAAERKSFVKDVLSLDNVIQEMGNPFEDHGKELYNIFSKTVCSSEVEKTVRVIESVGPMQYKQFVNERLESGTVSVYDTIPHNKFALFNTAPRQQAASKLHSQVRTLKENCSLFSKLYIATSSNRPADLDQFFSHENQEFPPSLSVSGSMRSTTKSELCKHIKAVTGVEGPSRGPRVDTKILDGGAIIYLLKPGLTASFEEYASKVFFPFLKGEMANVNKLAVVWDRYIEDSLKSMTREKRGSGIRTKVCNNTKPPTAWDKFLRDSENKTELFDLLSRSVKDVTVADGKELCITRGDSVVCVPPRPEYSALAPCNHEEADTRVFVHVLDAAQRGSKRIMVRTGDTDVVVIAISSFPQLADVEELWIHVKAGSRHDYLPIHEVVTSLGPAKSLALIGFHAFTGGDDVESLHTIGKVTAYSIFERYPESADAFIALAQGKVEEATEPLTRFVISAYSRARHYESLTECRRALFVKFNRAMECLPPTDDALQQHIKRASYVAQVWRQALVPTQRLPSPADYGWKRGSNGAWEIVWRTKPWAAECCIDLTRCKCKKECRGNCKCRKVTEGCSEFCLCPCDKKF